MKSRVTIDVVSMVFKDTCGILKMKHSMNKKLIIKIIPIIVMIIIVT